jgi:hypothetical protein
MSDDLTRLRADLVERDLMVKRWAERAQFVDGDTERCGKLIEIARGIRIAIDTLDMHVELSEIRRRHRDGESFNEIMADLRTRRDETP